MKTKTIIGIDVSKLTLDAYCLENNQHIRISNNKKGFEVLDKWFRQMKLSMDKIHVVCEHTGMYSQLLEDWLITKQIIYSIIPALQIKKSIGIVRGKNDKIDASRIAEYAVKHPEKLPLPIPSLDRALIRRLQTLVNYRDKLVVQRAGFMAVIEDFKSFKQLSEKDVLIKSHRQMIKFISEQIENIEKEVDKLMQSEEHFNHNYSLLQTIIGVGKQTALEVIILTGNFLKFESARKFATFCGTAPFPYDSGTSIKGKTKVSHLANKKMKSLLFMAAQSAIQHDPELKAYYQRRVEQGKNKMSTINVIKNKLIGRMFAVIERQTPFIKLHQFAA
jgi:transposase